MAARRRVADVVAVGLVVHREDKPRLAILTNKGWVFARRYQREAC